MKEVKWWMQGKAIMACYKLSRCFSALSWRLRGDDYQAPGG